MSSWLGVLGCGTDLGECNIAESETVYYDADGLPAYAGQALMQVSCGNGGYCHSAAASGAARRGSPEELDFDLQLASTTQDAAPQPRRVLSRGVDNVRDFREDIFDEVESGRMPPFGEASIEPLSGGPRYVHAMTEVRLPAIDSNEGLDMLRNWLACGAPIVERTEPLPGGLDPIGDVVAIREDPPEPRFAAIYERVLGPRCGVSCHHPDSSFFGSHELDLSTPEIAYMMLVGVDAAGMDGCRGMGKRVVPGDAAASILMQKLDGTQTCGASMPLGSPRIPMGTRDAVRTWIDNGAMND